MKNNLKKGNHLYDVSNKIIINIESERETLELLRFKSEEIFFTTYYTIKLKILILYKIKNLKIEKYYENSILYK